MYFTTCLILFLASCGNAADPLEDRMTKMEEKMNTFISRMENAMMKMTEEIQAIKTQISNETGENGNDDTDDITPRINTPLNDTNLEERVQALEFQMENVQEELMDVNDDVDILVSEVTIIHADQVVQDERLLEVEDEVELVGKGVATLEENVNALDASNAQLNVSVSALDVRVTTVESQNDNVTDDLNELSDRVDALGEDVTDLDESVTELEETTEGLNMAVNDLDSRVSDLEASGGNGTSELSIAFGAYAVITPIAIGSTVVFPAEHVNLGNGYNTETGEFTVPPGGAGVYFLFFYTSVGAGELAQFAISLNGNPLCYAYGDHNSVRGDYPATSCGAIEILNEGKCYIWAFSITSE